jgi:hypothetical protein
MARRLRMGNNLSVQGTAHLRSILDAALASEEGIMLEHLHRSRATHLRGTLHAMRNADRARSKRAFPADSPEHGRSAYDVLITEFTPTKDENYINLLIIRSDAAAKQLKVKDLKTGIEINLEDYL